MDNSKTLFRLFWAWNLEKEADWLAKMSESGWHLASCGWGFYRFTNGVPERRVYELDFMLLRHGEGSEYFTLYKDAGWVHDTSFSNWHYFHASADAAERRPAYSDVQSRKAKLGRVLAVLALAVLPAGIFGLLNPAVNGYFREAPVYYAIGGFSVFLIAVLIFSAIKIAAKIRRLG